MREGQRAAPRHDTNTCKPRREARGAILGAGTTRANDGRTGGDADGGGGRAVRGARDALADALATASPRERGGAREGARDDARDRALRCTETLTLLDAHLDTLRRKRNPMESGRRRRLRGEVGGFGGERMSLEDGRGAAEEGASSMRSSRRRRRRDAREILPASRRALYPKPGAERAETESRRTCLARTPP